MAEVCAQFATLAATRLKLFPADAHKHVHLYPHEEHYLTEIGLRSELSLYVLFPSPAWRYSMSSRFRAYLTVVPPVTIKVSRNGLHTTINWQSGETAKRVASTGEMAFGHVGNNALSGPLPTDRYLIPGTRRDYGAALTEVISPS